MSKPEQVSSKSSFKRPFELDHFFDAVNGASERSRNIFLSVIFTSLLILMSLVNSLKHEWSWYGSRFKLKKDIATFVVFPDEGNDQLGDTVKNNFYPYLNDIYSFILANEKMVYENSKNGKVFDTVDTFAMVLKLIDLKIIASIPNRSGYEYKNPFFAFVSGNTKDRVKQYNDIARAYKYALEHNLKDKSALNDDLNELLEAQLEHINLVRVPFLGISFDVNLLGFYGGLTLNALLILLYFSFIREHRNLKILFRQAWVDDRFHNYYFYEFVSMHQVLTIPKKLFKGNNSNEFLLRLVPFAGVIFPGVILSAVVFYDCETLDIGRELNPKLTDFSFYVSLSLLLPLFYMIYKVIGRLNRIDSLWDAQTTQYNIEFILENLGEDTVLDFDEFERKLSPSDLGMVKLCWYSHILRIKNMGTAIFEEDVREACEQFVKSCLTGSFRDNVPSFNKDDVDKCWHRFKKWFEKEGKKKIDFRFYISFIEDYLELEPKRRTWFEQLFVKIKKTVIRKR